MKSKTLKTVMTVIMAIFTLCSVSQIAFAVEVPEVPIKEADLSSLMPIVGTILGLIRGASIIAAILLIAVFGFKFIMGSANEKADYQKSFIPLIVGLIVVFAATYIADILLGIFANMGA